VWGRLEANPGYAVLADGLRAFVSEDAARLAPFALPDPDAIVRIVSDAGFDDVRATDAALPLTVPSADVWVEWVAAGGPTIRRNLAQLPAERRAEFGRFVRERLECYRTAAGLALPSRRTLVTASRSAG
jgi:hypothetical protein